MRIAVDPNSLFYNASGAKLIVKNVGPSDTRVMSSTLNDAIYEVGDAKLIGLHLVSRRYPALNAQGRYLTDAFGITIQEYIPTVVTLSIYVPAHYRMVTWGRFSEQAPLENIYFPDSIYQFSYTFYGIPRLDIPLPRETYSCSSALVYMAPHAYENYKTTFRPGSFPNCSGGRICVGGANFNYESWKSEDQKGILHALQDITTYLIKSKAIRRRIGLSKKLRQIFDETELKNLISHPLKRFLESSFNDDYSIGDGWPFQAIPYGDYQHLAPRPTSGRHHNCIGAQKYYRDLTAEQINAIPFAEGAWGVQQAQTFILGATL